MALMYRIRTVFTGVAGSPWYSNLYFDADTATAENASLAASAFWNECSNYIDNNVVGNIEAEIPVIEATTGEVQSYENSVRGPINCFDTGDALPRANQILVTTRTEGVRLGRRVLGRINVPGACESSNTEGVVTSGVVTAIQSAASSLVSHGTSTLVVYCPPRQTSGTTAIMGTYFPVTETVVRNQWAVLRSRRD